MIEKAYQITENTKITKSLLLKYNRFYFGDQCCEFNMISLLRAYFPVIKKSLKIKNITILTAPVSYKNMDELINILKEISSIKKIEVVINDIGVFYRLTKEKLNINFIWGNFLINQMRDPYLLNIHKEVVGASNLTIDSALYKNLFSKYNVTMVESYNVFQGIDLANKFDVAVYYPYVIYSITRYCPTKLIFDGKKTSSIVEECSGCKGKIQKDLKMNLKIGDVDVENYYIGNKQFYKNEKLIENENIKRIIYNYDIL